MWLCAVHPGSSIDGKKEWESRKLYNKSLRSKKDVQILYRMAEENTAAEAEGGGGGGLLRAPPSFELYGME